MVNLNGAVLKIIKRIYVAVVIEPVVRIDGVCIGEASLCVNKDALVKIGIGDVAIVAYVITKPYFCEC